MPPVGFEPTISAGERLKTYALDRAATGTDTFKGYNRRILCLPAFVRTCTVYFLFLCRNMFVGSVMKKKAEDKLAVYSFMCDVS